MAFPWVPLLSTSALQPLGTLGWLGCTETRPIGHVKWVNYCAVKNLKFGNFLLTINLPNIKKRSGMWHSPSAIISEAPVLKKWKKWKFFLHLPQAGILRVNVRVNTKWQKSPILILGRCKTPQTLCFEKLD